MWVRECVWSLDYKFLEVLCRKGVCWCVELVRMVCALCVCCCGLFEFVCVCCFLDYKFVELLRVGV